MAVITTIKKFLPIFFSCHQRPERSFFYKGKQFPICARCTGMLLGYFLGIISAVIFGTFWWFIIIPLAVPMIIDGVIQQCTAYESTNIRRLITGILFGIASIHIFLFVFNGLAYLAKLTAIAVFDLKGDF